MSAPPAPRTLPRDLAHWRSKAEAIEGTLSAITRGFRATDPTHPHHIHQLFSELYLCTTRRWLAGLACRDDSEYAYRVMCHFLQFYRDEVMDRLDHPPDRIVRHWRPYHRLARRLSIRSPISSHLLLISLGVRAHGHGDLGRAMCRTAEDMGLVEPSGPGLRVSHLKIFGQISDQAFYRAAHDYVALHHARQRGWRRGVLSSCRVGLFGLKPVWLPVFQTWRVNGYALASSALAQASVSSGTKRA